MLGERHLESRKGPLVVSKADGRMYNQRNQRFQLGFTDQQKKDLVAFLKTL